MTAFYETKGWYKSKTIWVSIVGILLAIAALFGIVPPEIEANQIVEIAFGIISALAIVFRVQADKTISST